MYLFSFNLFDGHVVQAIDNSQPHIVVWDLQALEESFFAVLVVQPLAHGFIQVFQLFLPFIEGFAFSFNLFLLSGDFRKLLAKELNQLDDLYEEAMDDRVVQVFKCCLISVLLCDLFLLIVILLGVLEQARILV